MMTNEQSAIFRQVLDTNWEIKELIEAGKFVDALPKVKQLDELKATLRQSMGAEAYDNFIDTGRRMFAPVEEEDE